MNNEQKTTVEDQQSNETSGSQPVATAPAESAGAVTPAMPPQPAATAPDQSRTHLLIARQWGQLIGTNIRSFDSNGQLLCFVHSKAFKLKEEIVFYRDEAKTQALFKTRARNIIDISATYDMFDNSGQLFGSLKRKGLSSMFVQDQWLILDTAGNQIGEITEDSALMGVVRRFVDFAAYFLPQVYSIKFGSTEVAKIKQKKNPLTVKYEYDIDTDSWQQYQLLFLAIANLLALIEARQN